MAFKHISVLADEAIEMLNIKPDGIYLDGTLGGGGHASLLVEKLSDKGLFIGIDQDINAIKAATSKLSKFENKNIKIFKENYLNFEHVLFVLGIDKLDGILLDLGVSSHQIDMGERGFSYMVDGPLDMRMNREGKLTAEYIVNHYSLENLVKIFNEYGQEKNAYKIAREIVKRRNIEAIKTTFQLVEITDKFANKSRSTGHSAKKVFQALRIEVNGELEVLQGSIDRMIDSLKPGGRLCIISFHSLEDRLIKHKFRQAERPCTCPSDFPICVCGKKPRGRIIVRKGIRPSEKEIKNNKRAMSARLRVFEKIGG